MQSWIRNKSNAQRGTLEREMICPSKAPSWIIPLPRGRIVFPVRVRAFAILEQCVFREGFELQTRWTEHVRFYGVHFMDDYPTAGFRRPFMILRYTLMSVKLGPRARVPVEFPMNSFGSLRSDGGRNSVLKPPPVLKTDRWQ